MNIALIGVVEGAPLLRPDGTVDFCAWPVREIVGVDRQ
jgi:hypothetical protein